MKLKMRRQSGAAFAVVLLCAAILLGLSPPRTLAVGCDWYQNGGVDGVYRISTAAELAELAELVNGTGGHADSFEGKTVLLEGDIDLGGVPWTPIGRCSLVNTPLYDFPFSGVFDGQGHRVSGLSIDSEEDHQALFGYMKGGAIRNLTVAGTVTTSRDYAAGVLAYQSGEQPVELAGCHSEADVSARRFAGGIFGGGSAELEDCENRGAVDAMGYAGGLCGSVSDSSLTGCRNLGAVSEAREPSGETPGYLVPSSYGGLVGSSTGSLTLEGCWNEGTVRTDAPQTGGLVGSVSSGYQSKGTLLITGSWNTGAVTGSWKVGGLFGTLEDNTRGAVHACYNTGAVQGDRQVGGLIGEQKTGAIQDCLQSGQVSSKEVPAGAVNGSRTESVNCYYLAGCLTIEDRVAENHESWSRAVTAEQLRSGEAAYLLDGGSAYTRSSLWTQSADGPVLGRKEDGAVYHVGLESIGAGRVELERVYFMEGEQVRLSLSPADGGMCQLAWAEDDRAERLTSTSGTGAWSFPMPASDVTVYARFIPTPAPSQTCRITLYNGDGNGGRTEIVRAGGVPLSLPEPERSGCVFLGWFTEPEDGSPVDTAELAATDLVLYAQWRKAGQAEVKFYWNYERGSWQERQWTDTGAPLAEPPKAPVHPETVGIEYSFLGWYTEPSGGREWDMGRDEVQGDMSLYARWEEQDVFLRGTTPEAAAVLTSEAELEALAQQVRQGETYEGRYFRLGNDLTLGPEWTGIGAGDAPFCGDIDGGGHTIQMDGTMQGLVGSLGAGGAVHDLVITGAMTAYSENPSYPSVGVIADSCSDGRIADCQVEVLLTAPEENHIVSMGGIAGVLNGEIDNCVLREGSLLTGYVTEYAGGLAGNAGGTVTRSRNQGELQLSAEVVGGICGVMSGTVVECSNTGAIANTRGGAAGIIGGSRNGAEISIERCVNSGTVTGVDVAAGILASYAMIGQSNYGSKVLIKSCGNTGDVTSTGGAAGGILGSPQRSPKASLSVEITDCDNRGTISGVNYVGGIAGMLDSYYALGGMGGDDRELVTITRSTNEGEVKASGDYAGGVVGANTMYGALELSHVESSGDVSGGNYVGGIAGYVDHSHYDNVAYDVTSSGDITASGSYVGGLMGYGAVSDGYWNGGKITVSEDSRFVNELVGDIHSLVINSQYDYKQEMSDVEPSHSEEEKRTTDSPPHTENAPVSVHPENAAGAPKPKVQTPASQVSPEQRAAPPAQSGGGTVFEVVRVAVQDNPGLIAIAAVAFLAILSFGAWHRYRTFRKQD